MKIFIQPNLQFKSNVVMSPALSNVITKNAASNPKQQTQEPKNENTAAVTFPQVSAMYGIQNNTQMPDEVKTLAENANKITKEAKELTQKVQKEAPEQLAEVNELYKKGEETQNGIVIRKITKNDNEETMEEFSQDGKKLLRRTLIKNGNVSQIAIDIEKDASGSEKAAKVYYFGEKELLAYSENRQIDKDSNVKEDKNLDFLDGRLYSYSEGFEEIEEDSYKEAKNADFNEEGKITSYEEGKTNTKDGIYTIEKCLRFDDESGQPYKATFGFKEVTTADKSYELSKEGWKDISDKKVYLF